MVFKINNRIKALSLVLLFSIALPIIPSSSFEFPTQYSEKIDVNEKLSSFEEQPLNEIEDIEKFFQGNTSSEFPLSLPKLSDSILFNPCLFSHSIPNYLSQPPPTIS